MLQVRSVVEVADNTGAKEAKIIGAIEQRKVLDEIDIGTVVQAHVTKASAEGSSKTKKGEVIKAVVVRTRKPRRRRDGSYIRFGKNAIVTLDKDNNPKGTRIFGPIPRELRDKFSKIISLAEEVL